MVGMVTAASRQAAWGQVHPCLPGGWPRAAPAARLGVVIPVRNGAKTLGAVLDALAGQTTATQLHVAVVINGSRDGTRLAAERHALGLRARGHICEILTTEPGRARAIRAGEERLPPGNRLYVDCDAVLSENAVAELEQTLRPGSGVHFAAPALVIGPSASRATRAYFRAWSGLPYVRESPVTYGVYAVSPEGRRRWSQLPLIHSDDKFTRLHFHAGERAVATSATYRIVPPHGLARLLKTRRRYLAGNRQLAGAFPELARDDSSRSAGSVWSLMRNPLAWPSSALFLAVYAAAAVLEARSG